MLLKEKNNFDELIKNLSNVHDALQNKAAKAVNQFLSLRNWVFGYYIVEYEQKGEDRAKYGENLIREIADRLTHIKGLRFRQLYVCKDFYLAYPYFLRSVTAKSSNEEIIRNPYILEFLDLEEKTEYSESELEQQILNHLQEFLIELGTGFCFEARQKRITFDNKHLRMDLIFYHRILKCHVLIDLKVNEFDYADAGQMNVYLNYYKENEMTEGDNPPIGIILCANKNDTLVKYATSGMDDHLFVSKYLIKLPEKKVFENFMKRELSQ